MCEIRHITSLLTSKGVSMEMPPFTMTSFQSAYGPRVVRLTVEYPASSTIILYSQQSLARH